MRPVFAFVLFAVLPFPVFAQETFAPLITEETAAFAYLDFRSVKLDAVEEQILKSGQEYLRLLSFDKKSEEATLADLQTEIQKMDAFIRPAWETITQTFGIQELALLVNMELMSALKSDAPFVLVAPWKNKTDDDLKKMLSLFPEDSDFHLISAGDFLFLFLKGFSDTENDSTAIKEWYKNLKPSPDGKIRQALKAAGNAELKFAAAIPKEMIAKLLKDELAVPKEIAGFLAFAQRKIEWFAAGVPFNAFALEPDKISPIVFITKTPKPSDAVQLRALTEQAIDLGFNAAEWAIEQKQKENNAEFVQPPLFFSFMKGLAKTFLPETDGDKLVLKINLLGYNAAYTSPHTLIVSSGAAVALLLPAVQEAREAARRMQCTTNIKLIVLAIHNYYDTYRGLPPLYTVDKDGKPLHSWRVLLLPFIEQVTLYEQIRLDEPWDSEHNKLFHKQMPKCYQCPSCPPANENKKCSYSAIVGGGLIPAKKAGDRIAGDFTRISDGTSNTIAVVEVHKPFCWMDPKADITLEEFAKGFSVGKKNKDNKDAPKAGSYHVVGTNAGLFDGAVRFLSDTITPERLKYLGDPADGNDVQW